MDMMKFQLAIEGALSAFENNNNNTKMDDVVKAITAIANILPDVSPKLVDINETLKDIRKTLEKIENNTKRYTVGPG